VAIGASLLVHARHAMADRPEVTWAARATSAWLGSSTPAAVPHVLPLVVAVSIVLLGPGAFSIDRYAFGPREVVISGRGDDPPSAETAAS
jgi:hypothetical protein